MEDTAKAVQKEVKTDCVEYMATCNVCKTARLFSDGFCAACSGPILPTTMVVLESPLAGDFETNRRYALWCAYDCYLRGEAVYASHLIYTQFLNDMAPHERTYGIVSGFKWAKHANYAVFYTDLGMSPGMEKAQNKWLADRKPVVFRTLNKVLFEKFNKQQYPNNTFNSKQP